MNTHFTAPAPFEWVVTPADWSATDDTVSVTAAAKTDIFTHPLTGAVRNDAALALTTPPDGDWQFSARLRVAFRAPWDAGALIVWGDDEHWAKLNFELCPEGRPSVYSVVTRGRSDDAFAGPVDGDRLWLRISRVDGAYGFHVSDDGTSWRLIRQFALPIISPRVGIEVQSPIGQGCVVDFDGIGLSGTRLESFFDGQ